MSLDYSSIIRSPHGWHARSLYMSRLTGISFSTQPSNWSGAWHSIASFTVETTPYNNASASPNKVTYQWYVQLYGSGTRTLITGATSKTYTVRATLINDGAQYTCDATFHGFTITSNPASIILTSAVMSYGLLNVNEVSWFGSCTAGSYPTINNGTGTTSPRYAGKSIAGTGTNRNRTEVSVVGGELVPWRPITAAFMRFISFGKSDGLGETPTLEAWMDLNGDYLTFSSLIGSAAYGSLPSSGTYDLTLDGSLINAQAGQPFNVLIATNIERQGLGVQCGSGNQSLISWGNVLAGTYLELHLTF